MCNVNIYVNQVCLQTNFTSCLSILKIPRTTQASKFNELEAQKIPPITDEIKLFTTKIKTLINKYINFTHF